MELLTLDTLTKSETSESVDLSSSLMPFRSFAPEVGEGPLTDSSMASWNVQLTTRFRTYRVSLAMSAVYYEWDFLYAHMPVRGAEIWKKRILSFKYFLSCNRDDWWLFRNRVVSFLDREWSSFFLITTRRWTEVITNVTKYTNLFYISCLVA